MTDRPRTDLMTWLAQATDFVPGAVTVVIQNHAGDASADATPSTPECAAADADGEE